MNDADPFEETERTRVESDAHIPRKIFHALAGSVVPTLYWFELIPRDMTITLTVAGAALFIGFDGARLAWRPLNRLLVKIYRPLMKSRESHVLTGASWYCFSLAASLLLLSPLVATLALYFTAFGDPAASIIGRRYGSIPLINGRTLQGSLTFFALCAAIAIGGFHLPLLPALMGALAAALGELVADRLDDNLTVPALSGLALTFMEVS